MPGVVRGPFLLLRLARGRGRPQCPQAADDALAHEIAVLHLASRRTYGVPRIHAELRRLGGRVNRKRVARVMRESDICGVTAASTAH
ncbi:IS3 family transposase [Streptomyces sp. CC219B]|uniref:IS3 family transposase n=1 Tax=Streptomyces sp. CC219B TaxID=3044574 RepID=UPI0024A96532|nr:IS3 family transposase [Streptomyces sp. CC219B]